MLRTMTKTTLAAFIAASFSVSAIAQDEQQQEQEWQQQQQEAERDHRGDRDKRDKSDKEFAEVIKEDDSYSRFAEAWEASGIEDELDSDTTYTVFVPTNEAFGGGPAAQRQQQAQAQQQGMEQGQERTQAQERQRGQQAGRHADIQQMIDDDDTDGLRELLSHHIVEGEVRSDNIAEQGITEETLNGNDVRITATAGSMRVNNARVVEADIETSNIIVHRVDTLLSDNGYAAE
ncbi:hypothetical protein CWE09_02460 [Aliidiomarina minuta]|uniref:FAS1 domain-containing protein n=1 Tax=Aliidiomarina minuta TaxID=880057 RepID=A0A432W6B0_9GAMM|nr:fasciclin domain-containing protein [Aliidiomarina minuta]RUO25613.1 hypothetical protein CWE09_02460 [Aliidiomarina minuta]